MPPPRSQTPFISYRRATDLPHWPPPPPKNESPEDAHARLDAEQRAKAVNDQINREIEVERSEKKKKPAIKILLVGQAESGKSTTLKNFQLHYTPRAFQADAEAWRSVIQLNLVRSINFILETLSQPSSFPSSSSSASTSTSISSASTPGGPTRSTRAGASVPYSPHLQRLKLSLTPLRSVETNLARQLSAEPSQPSDFPNNFNGASNSWWNSNSNSSGGSVGQSPVSVDGPDYAYTDGLRTSGGASEGRALNKKRSAASLSVRVRSYSGWKRLARAMGPSSPTSPSSPPTSTSTSNANANNTTGSGGWYTDTDTDPTRHWTAREREEFTSARAIMVACAVEMDALWRSADVHRVLRAAGAELGDQSGFFLNDIMRIASEEYVPTPEDILHARLSTIGVEEHRLVMEKGPEAGQEWWIYDCGGSRSQRAAWAPYFDAVNALIFLAPVGAFDQKLEEDRRVNRLDDTLHLWRAISANKLLTHLEIVLFLNKTDLLQRKLASGVRFAEFVPSFDDQGGKKNNYESVIKYISGAFSAVYKQLSPKPRRLHVHLTSVIDARATRSVLGHVREAVLIDALNESSLL